MPFLQTILQNNCVTVGNVNRLYAELYSLYCCSSMSAVCVAALPSLYIICTEYTDTSCVGKNVKPFRCHYMQLSQVSIELALIT
jgi:hypothetical protein